MLTIEHLQVNFGDFQALNIREKLTIESGDRIGIIGSNGAGKSTLVKAILGLVPYKGRIQSSLKHDQMAVHLQQNDYVKSVPIKNIIQAILGTSISDNAKLVELIEFFDFEKCLKKKFPQLSGGQKQRLTIILVLMQDAPLTFFDEVTSGLDFETRTQLMEKILNWYEGKSTSLCIVSHYYDELEALTNKLLILEKGEVLAFGETRALFKQFCGEVVLTIEDTAENRAITKNREQLLAPNRMLAFPCNSQEQELELVNLLSTNNINYKRSDLDIEILFTNARQAFKQEG